MSELIRIQNNTKSKLDLKKANDSYDTVIARMITYFEITGLDINSLVINPTVAIKQTEENLLKVNERIIKILNRFKTDYFIGMKGFIEKDYALSKDLSNTNNVEGINEKDIENMVLMNNKLEKKISELELELQRKNINIPVTNQLNIKNIQDKCIVIKEQLNALKKNLQTSNIAPENMQVKKAFFTTFYKISLSELNVIIDM